MHLRTKLSFALISRIDSCSCAKSYDKASFIWDVVNRKLNYEIASIQEYTWFSSPACGYNRVRKHWGKLLTLRTVYADRIEVLMGNTSPTRAKPVLLYCILKRPIRCRKVALHSNWPHTNVQSHHKPFTKIKHHESVDIVRNNVVHLNFHLNS